MFIKCKNIFEIPYLQWYLMYINSIFGMRNIQPIVPNFSTDKIVR